MLGKHGVQACLGTFLALSVKDTGRHFISPNLELLGGNEK